MNSIADVNAAQSRDQTPFRTLLFTPPMVDTHTAYPATPYLTGFLRGRGFDVRQSDLSIEIFHKLFSREGLQRMHAVVLGKLESGALTKNRHLEFILDSFDAYLDTIDPVVAFLQGRDPTLGVRLANRTFVPEGANFKSLEEMPRLGRVLSEHGNYDRAKFVATIYIRDLVDFVRAAIDPHFGLECYAERLASSQPSFDPLYARLKGEQSLIDEMLEELVVVLLDEHRPNLVGLTAPFPGNVYGALRIGALVKAHSPSTRVVLGGGYVNTELRALSDARVFEFVDYITFDDGERPIECLIEHLQARRPQRALLRTMLLRQEPENTRVAMVSAPEEHDIAFAARGTPTYAGLDLNRYVPLLDSLNPMARLSHEFHWNKLTLAHGCYWKKCNFCDVSLNYIDDYQPEIANRVVDRMEELIAETGRTGFHFVDEAAPPKLLRALSRRLIERRVAVSWWGNLRFEKTFTPALTDLMASAGCVAVTGGLEVASDRLLKLMNKGVTVAQVARVTKAFRNSGIFVHAYLIYGFASQTLQETVDSLEIVRQMFATGCLNSAYWHRFGVTAHSPIGKNPGAYGIKTWNVGERGLSEAAPPAPVFAVNTLEHEDSVDCPHAKLGPGLKKALHHYMLGEELERAADSWFDIEVPKTSVAPNMIETCLGGGNSVSSVSVSPAAVAR